MRAQSHDRPPPAVVKPMAARVRDGVADPSDAAYGRSFLELVLQTWRDAETARRRTTVLIVALIAAFELVAANDVKEVAVGGFKLQDLADAKALIPAVVAHLGYEWLALSGLTFRCRWAVDDLARHALPGFWRNDLHWLLAPAMQSGIGSSDWEKLRASASPLAVVRTLGNGIIIVAFLGGVVAFLIDAYIRVFGEPHHLGVQIFSALVAVVSLIRAVALGLDERAAGEMVPQRKRTGAQGLQ